MPHTAGSSTSDHGDKGHGKKSTAHDKPRASHSKPRTSHVEIQISHSQPRASHSRTSHPEVHPGGRRESHKGDKEPKPILKKKRTAALPKIMLFVSLAFGIILLIFGAFVGDHMARQPDFCTDVSGESTIYEVKPGARPQCQAQRLTILAVVLTFIVGMVQVFGAVINMVAPHPRRGLMLAHFGLAVLAIIAAIVIVVQLKVGKFNNLIWFEFPISATDEEYGSERNAMCGFFALVLIIDAVICIVVGVLFVTGGNKEKHHH